MGSPTDPDDEEYQDCNDGCGSMPGAINLTIFENSTGELWEGTLDQHPTDKCAYGGYVNWDIYSEWVQMQFCNLGSNDMLIFPSVYFIIYCGGILAVDQNLYPFGHATSALNCDYSWQL